MITVNINGNNISVEPQTSILQICRQHDIYIPTLCNDPQLSLDGSCRMCVVEIKGWNRLVTACTTICHEGMEILTESQSVFEARQVILELLVARHPLHCTSCEVTGECALESMCARYHVTSSRYAGEVVSFSIFDNNPYIERDYDRCIMCTRCVRACKEITGANAIEVSARGHLAKISTAFNSSLKRSSCVFCGQCVMVCPVGALRSKITSIPYTFAEADRVATTCAFCGTGCSLDLEVKAEKVVGVHSRRTADDNSVNAGVLCVRGRFGWDFIYDKGRIQTPYIRENNKLKSCSWDTALEYSAEKINNIKSTHGADALAMFSSSRLTNEENYLAQKLMRAAVGSNNVNQCSKMQDLYGPIAMMESLGVPASTSSIKDLTDDAEVIWLVSANINVKHPVIAFQLKQKLNKGKTRLIVADRRATDITRMADVYLHLDHGSEITLLNGIMHIIIDQCWEDREFIDKYVQNYDQLKEFLKAYTPEHVSELIGIDTQELYRTAKLYTSTKKAIIAYGTSFVTGSQPRENVLALCNLALLTGNLGRPGSGVMFMREQNNIQGSCDMGGMNDVYTDYQPIKSKQVREKFEQAWGKQLPSHTGFNLATTLQKINRQEIKGVLVFGSNPIKRNPRLSDPVAVFKNLDFILVQDIILNETAALADVILPGVSFAEKDGTYTSLERRVQRIRQAITPMSSSQQEWKTICQLSERLGYHMTYDSSEEIFEEIRSLTPGYAGISYAKLEKGGIFWPCPDEEHPGTPILLTKNNYVTQKARFYVVENKH